MNDLIKVDRPTVTLGAAVWFGWIIHAAIRNPDRRLRLSVSVEGNLVCGQLSVDTDRTRMLGRATRQILAPKKPKRTKRQRRVQEF